MEALETGNSFALMNKQEKTDIVAYVRRWGGTSSEAVLDPTCELFFVPNVEGFIGYRLVRKSAFVYGDPICAPEDYDKLVTSFHKWNEENGRTVVYITATQKFKEWAMQNVCKASVECVKELYLDPFDDPRERKGDWGCLVRRKTKHALREGVEIKEYLGKDSNIEKAMEQVAFSWFKSRKGLQIHTSHIHLFGDRLGKRWMYAQKDNKIIGVMVLVRLEERQGWLLNRYMALPDAPGGTPELMIINAIETLKKEGCHYLNFGIVPMEKMGAIEGLNSFSILVAKIVFSSAIHLFHLKRKMDFWQKFHPEEESSYLLFSDSKIGLSELFGLTKTLNVAF